MGAEFEQRVVRFFKEETERESATALFDQSCCELELANTNKTAIRWMDETGRDIVQLRRIVEGSLANPDDTGFTNLSIQMPLKRRRRGRGVDGVYFQLTRYLTVTTDLCPYCERYCLTSGGDIFTPLGKKWVKMTAGERSSVLPLLIQVRKLIEAGDPDTTHG